MPLGLEATHTPVHGGGDASRGPGARPRTAAPLVRRKPACQSVQAMPARVARNPLLVGLCYFLRDSFLPLTVCSLGHAHGSKTAWDATRPMWRIWSLWTGFSCLSTV
jgi:hypothetical protein